MKVNKNKEEKVFRLVSWKHSTLEIKKEGFRISHNQAKMKIGISHRNEVSFSYIYIYISHSMKLCRAYIRE